VIGWSVLSGTPIDRSHNSCYTGSGLSADRHHLHVRRWPSMPSKSPTPMCCTYLPKSSSRLNCGVRVSLSVGLIAIGIYEAITVILEQTSWLWVLPGVATILAMLCINIVGDGLLDAMDPRGLLASKAQTGRRSPAGGGGLRAAPRAHRPVKSREEVQTS